MLPVWHLLLRKRGLYEPWRERSRLAETRALLEACTLASLTLAAATSFWPEARISLPSLLAFWLGASGGLALWRGTLRTLLRTARRRGFNTRSVLILGTGSLALEAFERLRGHPETGLQVVGFVGERPAAPPGLTPPFLGHFSDARRLVDELEIDHVVVALERGDRADPTKLLNELSDSRATLRIVLDLEGLPRLRTGVEELDGLHLLRLVESPLVGWSRVVKRGFDLAAGTLALLLCAPLMGAIALAIVWTSGRPVLYRQTRASLDGRAFRIIKFRTMHSDAEGHSGPRWAEPDDPRRTSLGALLRRLSLDELPQLWNVLRGEMSLVGPRPERPEFVARFSSRLPSYALRHRVRPGITGWAQVNGCRGSTSIERRLQLDLEYVRNWSLWLDVRIVLLTLVRVLGDPNAY
jgi:exopolysaccharide biosynthesis polyprenyl glycosylphosphotransferase